MMVQIDFGTESYPEICSLLLLATVSLKDSTKFTRCIRLSLTTRSLGLKIITTHLGHNLYSSTLILM